MSEQSLLQQLNTLGLSVLKEHVMSGKLSTTELPRQLGLTEENTNKFLMGKYDREITEGFLERIKTRITEILNVKESDIEIISAYEKEKRRFLPVALDLARNNMQLYVEKKKGFFVGHISKHFKGKFNPAYLEQFIDEFMMMLSLSEDGMLVESPKNEDDATTTFSDEDFASRRAELNKLNIMQ